MKRASIAGVLIAALVATLAFAQGTRTQRVLSRALANTVYCQLTGCTMTGAITLGASATQGAAQKTLTESAATSFVRIDVASGAVVGGYVEYTIEANDGTDFQSRSGILPFTAVNKAGTETATVATVGAATEVAAVSVGTLTNTFTAATTPVNGIEIAANAVSSLTQTTLRVNYRVNITSGTATVTGL